VGPHLRRLCRSAHNEILSQIGRLKWVTLCQSGDNLTPDDIVKYTAALAAICKESTPGNRKMIIGRDSRTSGDMVRRLVSGTLQAMGMDVIDIGMAPTPTVELAVAWEQAAGGIIITASHNPGQWNALKLLGPSGEFLPAEEGDKVLKLAEKGSVKYVDPGQVGTYTAVDGFIDRHIEAILKLELVDVEAIRGKNFRIAVDAVNSVGGIAVPALLKALGVEDVIELNCEPDGRFAHNPEPLPEHLTGIAKEVDDSNAHLGLAVDPDVDRLAIINEDGTMFGEEYTLVTVADYVLKHKPGNTVSNLSSTRALQDVTEKRGGKYFASAVGEVNVVAAMKQHNAVIGGEGNGGVIYPELHFGRDALVAIALFLSHLAHYGKSCSMLRSTYPNYHISKNKIQLSPDVDVKRVLADIRKKYSKQPVDEVDGLRIEFDKDWVHLRMSNTEPVIRIYTESTSETTASAYANKFMDDIREVVKGHSR
jgi:phosphomannomutase